MENQTLLIHGWFGRKNPLFSETSKIQGQLAPPISLMMTPLDTTKEPSSWWRACRCGFGRHKKIVGKTPIRFKINTGLVGGEKKHNISLAARILEYFSFKKSVDWFFCSKFEKGQYLKCSLPNL